MENLKLRVYVCIVEETFFGVVRGIMDSVAGQWTRRYEFKSSSRLSAYTQTAYTLRKGINPIIFPSSYG